MAEQVQSILERMVPHLKDLRDRGIFTPDEVRSIVDRRRRSEYLLQRRGGTSRKSDYLRYIEDEIMLERLRKLRKEKVLMELKNERKNSGRDGDSDDDDGSSDDDDDATGKRKHAYKSSGPGDSSITSHIHFLYQRTLRKFHYPLDVILSYAAFAKETKSFKILGRVYAEGIQHHPREVGLWIEAASFEYFGHVAEDYENGNKEGEGVNSKIAGSSIQNARVLLQRGLRINKSSPELWLQYFALELHYVQKLRGRREILELGLNSEGLASDGQEGDGSSSDDEASNGIPANLLPARIIFDNAIRAIPSDVQFRLKFVEAARTFPQTKGLEVHVMESVTRDFGESVEGWVARISYADELLANGGGVGGPAGRGFLAGEGADDGDADGSSDDGEEDRPSKRARVEAGEDAALALLREAIDAVPTSRMYLECARFLRLRIRRLLDREVSIAEGGNADDADDEDDVSHLIGPGGDARSAAVRHSRILSGLYDDAEAKNVSSAALVLDRVDYLLCAGRPIDAEGLLSRSVGKSDGSDASGDVRLWLRWAEVAGRMEGAALAPSSSSLSILRRGLKRTPLHDRRAHTLLVTEAMRLLMAEPLSSRVAGELRSLFQKLVLLSQGSEHSVSNVRRNRNGDDDGADDDMDDEEANVASTFVSYLKYTMLNGAEHNDPNAAASADGAGNDAVRSTYASVLYSSNYGKSASGKADAEVLAMKSFFDGCLQYELASSGCNIREVGMDKKKGKGDERKARKLRLRKLYEAAIEFFEGGAGAWRTIVDEYQRGLDSVKYSI